MAIAAILGLAVYYGLSAFGLDTGSTLVRVTTVATVAIIALASVALTNLLVGKP
jgi:hypothetical protein